MASFFERFLNWLLGRSSTNQPAVDPVTPIPSTPVRPSTPASTLTLTLARQSRGENQVSGTLAASGITASTLEHPVLMVPAGTYSLALRADGGLHSAYWFRFPEQHKGMIHLVDPTTKDFRYLRLGTTAPDAQGGVVIPQIGEYLDLYSYIAEKLQAGTAMTLVVK